MTDSPRLRLRVGRFEINRMDDLLPGRIWIRDCRTGEGGAFPEQLLEELVAEFFDAHF